ncbi:MAG: hypothetical protein ACQESE_01180 [Nanobdellota archaeon]
MRKKLSKNKKASWPVLIIMDLIVAVMIILILVGIYEIFTDESQVDNIAMARDVATLVDAVHATERDLIYSYPESFYEKDLFFNRTKILVTKDVSGMSGKLASLRFLSSYPVHLSDFITINAVRTIDGAKIILEKKDRELSIISERSFHRDEETIPTSSLTREQITLDILTEKNTHSVQQDLANAIDAQLEIEQFNVSSNRPTASIIMASKSEGRITIYYEETHKKSMEPIAEILISYLEKSDDLAVTSQPLQYTHDTHLASIKIAIPETVDYQDYFMNQNNKDAFVERIIYSLKQYYPTQ